MNIDYYELSNKYDLLEHGMPKMIGIKKAIELAQQEKDYVCTLKFMEDYMHEAFFCDDAFQAMILFPEYAAIYDTHPEIHNEYTPYDFLWVYKWIIGNTFEFYQISHEKIMEYFEDFKNRCIENGFSLRTYYMKLADYLEEIDIKKFKEVIKKYKSEKRDILSDCEACELDGEVYFELNYGDFQTALKLAKPILNKQKKCADVPRITYANLLDYYIKQNDMENATIYEKLLLKEIKNVKHLVSLSKLLKYYTLTDINKGIRIFKKHLPEAIQTKDPIDKFNFELQVYHLLKETKRQRKRNTIQLLLDKKFPLYKEDGVYQFDELIEYFFKNITEIAQKFDNRNKNNNFSIKINQNI